MPGKQLLLYYSMTQRAGRRLAAAVRTAIPGQAIERVHTIQSLTRRLKKPKNGLEVAVILIDGPQMLQDILPLQQALERLRLIMILPDDTPQALSQAHCLGPRYLTSLPSDFIDVAAVAGRILTGINKP